MRLLNPRTSQPQTRAAYRSGWSARPLTGLIGGEQIAIDGGAVTTVGTVTRVPTQGGMASSHATGATNIRRAVIAGSTLGTSSRGASLLAVFRSRSTVADQRIVALGSDSGSSGNTLFSIQCGNTSTANLRIAVGGSNSNVFAETTGLTIDDGLVHSVVLTASSFTSSTPAYVAYMDGKQVLSGTGGISLGSANTYQYILAAGFRRGGTDTAGAACDVLLAVPFDGCLSSAEALALTNNPWQLFEPRRIWVPVSVAASGTASITAAAGAATASTLAGSSTAATTVTAAAGAATASSIAGASTAVASFTQADGVATAATLQGSSGSSTITQADGTATAATMAGSSVAAAAITQADGVGSGATMQGSDAAAVPVVETRRKAGGKAVRKRYLIRGKFYLLADDELAVLIGQELADISRREVKVAAPKAKPRVISAEAWAAVKPLARLEALAERMEEGDGDDEDELILMMV